jgi:electron transport complex protein RnfB
MPPATVTADDLVARIDAVLPQTQCTKCGQPGCRPYAEAIAAGQAEINQCPPGGQAGVAKIARVTGRDPLPLNPVHGIEQPVRVAVIDETLCIGCTLCIQACPVDAIVGATRRMHTVLADWCTGCDLCVPPCPMDCIAMVPVAPPRDWSQADADTARHRHAQRSARLIRVRADNEARLAAKAVAKLDELDGRDDLARAQIEQKKAVVQAAIDRARARRATAMAGGSR